MELEMQEFYTELLRIGVCKRCTLRYITLVEGEKCFENPEANFSILGINFRGGTNVHENPCIICLGYLQDDWLLLLPQHWKLQQFKQSYAHDTYRLFISIPICCLVREHSVRLYMQEKFPNFKRNEVTKLNVAFRLALDRSLSRILGKKNSIWASLLITYVFDYDGDEEELSVMNAFTEQTISRQMLGNLLLKISDDDFKKYVSVPPKLPCGKLKLTDLTCTSKVLCLMGNYCKYVRGLCQRSYYNLEDSSKPLISHFSVGSIIEDKVRKILRCSNEIEFTASNPEDKSVRVLGKGRIFKIEIQDPRFDKIKDETLREIEREIAKTNVISINNLQIIDRRHFFSISESQKLSPAMYKLLCSIPIEFDANYAIMLLNQQEELSVQQKTVIRVIKGSNLKIRLRKIFNMKAEVVPDRSGLLIIDLCSEGGLCIDEFVSGDCGRTKPSLKSILGCSIELLALDIVDFTF